MEIERTIADNDFESARFADAWAAYDANSEDRGAKRFIARSLYRHPDKLTPVYSSLFLRLLRDRDVDPEWLSRAGWRYLLRYSKIFRSADLSTLAKWAEEEDFIGTLLSEAPVTECAAETRLTQLRRWLLLQDQWQNLPRLAEAFRLQASLNGSAWQIAEAERAWLDTHHDVNFALAYGAPEAINVRRSDLGNPIIRAVAEQYENWPFPPWTRVTAPPPGSLGKDIRKIDPDGETMPSVPEILVAGCGTGKEAALWAARYPDAHITAVDISRSSLHYAKARCTALSLQRIEFRQLDLHRVADLNRCFDAISCSGVLHHLPDPERGWAALVGVLKPGGVMRMMLYSRLARLPVLAMRLAIGDLIDQPLNGDLLREVRRLVVESFGERASVSRDLYTLAGTHDLLMHRHEDPFDLPRIKRAVDGLGLTLLHFLIPDPWERRRYREEFPNDHQFRDIDALSAFEMRRPAMFSEMYQFWCRKPGDCAAA